MTLRRSPFVAALVSALIAIAAIVLSMGIGPARVPLNDRIVLDLRLPRALLAAIAGGSLAVSGAVFQAMLRNPLADPYVLGVSGGAALGAVLSTALHLSSAFLPVAALIGALLSILLVFGIALHANRRVDARVLILAGVILSSLFQAIILLLLTFADVESFRSAIFWMMGSFATASWRNVILLAGYAIPALVVLFALARPFNLLAAGEETALYLGVNVDRINRIAYFVASVLVGASVASCGAIGFVGLVVPHAVRLIGGSDHRLVIPASLFLGATFLVLCDTIARTIAAPAELPVGVVTALIGVPLFIVLLVRRST